MPPSCNGRSLCLSVARCLLVFGVGMCVSWIAHMSVVVAIVLRRGFL